MRTKYFDKAWTQYATLAAIASLFAFYLIYYFEPPYEFDWGIYFRSHSTYKFVYIHQLLKGLGITLVMSVISAMAALVLGTFFGLARLSKFKPLYALATAYVELFRNTPLLVQIYFIYFALPQALPDAAREFVFYDIDITWFGLNFTFEFWTMVLALSLYTGAYMAEVIRAGLQSIPRGLLEAAYSSGLSYLQVLRKIILPTAFRNIIPPLGSEFLNNLKNSSLSLFIGAMDLAWQMTEMSSLTFKNFEFSCLTSIFYLGTCLGISAVMNAVNRRLKIGGPMRKNVMDICLDCICRPSGGIYNAVARPIRRANRKRKLRKASLSYTPFEAALNQGLKYGGKTLSLGLKGLFLAILAYLLWKSAVAVAGFSWAGLFKVMKLLLIYRFPAEDAIYMGLGGLTLTVLLSIFVLAASFPLGLLVGLGRVSKNRIFSIPCTGYIELIRGNPLIMVIFWSYYFIGIIRGEFLDPILSGAIAMTVFNAAYLAEIVRAGIQNLPPGQFEAAYSTGLSYWMTMRKIVLPQALKQMLPAIVGQSVAMIKDTSLISFIGVVELTRVVVIMNNRFADLIFELYFFAAVCYFILCYALSLWANRLEHRLSPERVQLEM
ncbi:MAG: amino acid ABC transporter permease [Desulfovibrionaceae bacterium]